MSTIKVTNIQHPDAETPAIELTPEGSIQFEAADLTVASTDDTGGPWNIPYIDGGAAGSLAGFSEDLADAVADGLSAAGGLVAVKSAIFTGTQTNSTAAGANFAVTDLTITHEVADPANKLIISAFLGAAANSGGRAQVGIAVHDGTGLIAIGDADGVRTRLTAGGPVDGGGGSEGGQAVVVTMPSVTFVHTPGDTTSRTYTVRAINVREETQTVFINRTESDVDRGAAVRAVSSLVIQEVKV